MSHEPESELPKIPPKRALIEGVHYYINEQGYWVFTELYHKLRGYCCESGCKHCPYGFSKKSKLNEAEDLP